MQIQSTRFGKLDVPEDNIYHFPSGLPGFPDEKKFAFLESESQSPFFFLQSTANPHLTFVVVDPFFFFSDYTFELTDEIVQEMKLSKENPPKIFNIVTVRDPLDKTTVNLLAPVVVNRETKIAVQIVLEKTEYTTRHLLFPNGLPQKAEGGR